MEESTLSSNVGNPYWIDQRKVSTGVTDGSKGWRKRQIAEWIAEGEVELPPLPLTKSQYGFDHMAMFSANDMWQYAKDAIAKAAGGGDE